MNDSVTYFPKGIVDKQRSRGHQRVFASEVYAKLMDPDHGDRITELRRLAKDPSTTDVVLDKYKKSLPAVVWQSLFRDGLDRRKANVEAATGFVPIDIDSKDNPDVDLLQMKQKVAELKFVEGVWVSPKGAGLHGVARVRLPRGLPYRQAAEQVVVVIEEATGLKLDRAMLDPIQALYLSYDPETVLKEEHEVEALLPSPLGLSCALGPALYQACHGGDPFRDRSSFATRLGGHIAAGELKADDPWIEEAKDAICKTSSHPTECRRKLEDSIEYGKSTYVPDKFSKGKGKGRQSDADEASGIAQTFLAEHVLWSTNVYAEKSARPVFRLVESAPNPRWVEVNEQALLCMMGLDKDPDRAFNGKVLYALSLMAQVKGPECEPAEVNNRLMNLRNGVYDTATGTLSAWTPEMKFLGSLPRAYLHAGHPSRVAPARNLVHQFLKRYGKDVYNRLLYWVFPKIFSPSAGNYIICLVGLPGCGKTTLLEGVCLRCVGAEATLPLEVVEKNSHELTQWEECYWNFFDEMSPDGLRRCEILKRLATQSTLTVNPKGSRIYPVRCVTTPVFGSNVMMWFPESDGAIFDRLIAVFFTVRFRHTQGQIEDLGAYLDTIPEVHWDSFYSDVLDIARENRHTKPPVAQMEAEYKLYRDRFFVFMSSAVRNAPGTRTRLSAIVEMYLKEHEEIRKRAARNHKEIEPEKRGTGTLYDLAGKYCAALGLKVERDGHTKCEFVRDVAFSPETSSASPEVLKSVEFPDEYWNASSPAQKSARKYSRKKSLIWNENFKALRITPALFSIFFREESKKRRNQHQTWNRRGNTLDKIDRVKSARLVRVMEKNMSNNNDLQAEPPADVSTLRWASPAKTPVAAKEIRRCDLRTDFQPPSATEVETLVEFRQDLLNQIQRSEELHVDNAVSMLPPHLQHHVPSVVDELVDSGLITRDGAWLCVVRTQEKAD